MAIYSIKIYKTYPDSNSEQPPAKDFILSQLVTSAFPLTLLIKFTNTYGLYLIYFLLGRLIISLPISLYKCQPSMTQTNTKEYPICFNLYKSETKTHHTNVSKIFFWEEYHSLKAINDYSDELCKNLIIPRLTRDSTYLPMRLLFEFSIANFRNFAKILAYRESDTHNNSCNNSLLVAGDLPKPSTRYNQNQKLWYTNDEKKSCLITGVTANSI